MLDPKRAHDFDIACVYTCHFICLYAFVVMSYSFVVMSYSFVLYSGHAYKLFDYLNIYIYIERERERERDRERGVHNYDILLVHSSVYIMKVI